MGLSDLYTRLWKLVASVLKGYFKKVDPEFIIYKNYENFENENFSNALENKLIKLGSLALNYSILKNICLDVVNKHASLKKKYVSQNHAE